MDDIFQLLLNELELSTKASEPNCQQVATRLSQEVGRICTESKRIQASGDIDSWALNLAKHRLQQCLRYYRLGSRRGREDLHSTLSAVVYRYISPPQAQSSYQARLTLISDFLQVFYMESLTAFRREAQLPTNYQPHTLLELAEYMAFTERYGKRRIPLPGHRSQQLIILRAQTFSQQQPDETPFDWERVESGGSDTETSWNAASMRQVRETVMHDKEQPDDSLRAKVVDELIAYLQEKKQEDCVNYFVLRLQDLPANEIEKILGIDARKRDYLQQRFKYHLIKFSLAHRWELVHQWLEADLEHNLGLTPHQWQSFRGQLDPLQDQLLQLKLEKCKDAAIAQALGCTVTQMHKQWFKILEQAWDIRNYEL